MATTLHPQILAANIVCLAELIYGSCNAIPSTMLYSFERGSEGISMSLEEASWARKHAKVSNLFQICMKLILIFSNHVLVWTHHWLLCWWLGVIKDWPCHDLVLYRNTPIWILASDGSFNKCCNGTLFQLFPRHICRITIIICG